MARVHFGSGIVHDERPIYKRTPPSESLSGNLGTVSAIRTELEALKESPELTVKLKLFGT